MERRGNRRQWSADIVTSTSKYLCDDGVIRYPNGREECDLTSKKGMDAYIARKRTMWERQGKMCCLHGHIEQCPGKLFWQDATFDHEIPRGHGGGARDDRIELPDGRRQNGAAHAYCNRLKGSRRIPYNAAYNAQLRQQEALP